MITVLGSCRQYSVAPMTDIQEKISYPHYTKEILEVIRFCKYGSIHPEDTRRILRTAILENRDIHYDEALKKTWEETDVFIIEIASNMAYLDTELQRYVHHIMYDDSRFNQDRHRIQQMFLDDETIEEDLVEIKKELTGKPIIIVSHIVTYQHGRRYELVSLLERLCKKHDLLFLNPTHEFEKRGLSITNYLMDSNHYNDAGHAMVKTIYDDFLVQMKSGKTN